MSLKVILYDKDDDKCVQKCHGLKTEKVYETKGRSTFDAQKHGGLFGK